MPLKRLGDVPLRCHWLFHLRLVRDVKETYWWDVKDMYHWDVLVTFQQDVVRCFIWDVPVTLLRGTQRCYFYVATTSCCWVGRFIIVNVWIMSDGKIHRKTPVPEFTFSGNFIKNKTLAQMFPMAFAKFLRTPFLQKTSGQLLLTKITIFRFLMYAL